MNSTMLISNSALTSEPTKRVDESSSIRSQHTGLFVFTVGVAVAAGLVIGLALVLALAFPSRSTAAATKTVDMLDLKFTVPSISVAPGDTVTWTNSDKVRHTVTSKGGSLLASPDIKGGESFSFTFPAAGTFPYFCEIHPDMKGTVTVAAAAAAVVPPPPAPKPTAAAPAMPGHSSMATPAPSPTKVAPAPPIPAPVPVPAPVAMAPSGATPPVAASPVDPPPAPVACVPTFEPLGPLVKHLQAAHLEESPSQQIEDLLDLDQYTLTHTVLLNNMLTGGC